MHEAFNLVPSRRQETPGVSPGLLEVSAVSVSYGSGARRKDVLKEVSLELKPGQTVGLVGESGSGKSTLGRAILGLAPVRSGRVLFDGVDIATLRPRQRRRLASDIQVIFQDPYSSLNPAMTIREILTEPLIARSVPRSTAKQKVSDLLDRVAMPASSLDRYAREFSGGQRQRVAIARALALDPRLIVCDEPVSALDMTTQARVLQLLHELQLELNIAYLFISHDLAVVRHVSDRVAVMLNGEIVEEGPAEDVTSSPQHPYTRRLLAANLSSDPVEQRERRERRATAYARTRDGGDGR